MPRGSRHSNRSTRSNPYPAASTSSASQVPPSLVSSSAIPSVPSVTSVSDLSMSQFVALVGQVVRDNIPSVVHTSHPLVATAAVQWTVPSTVSSAASITTPSLLLTSPIPSVGAPPTSGSGTYVCLSGMGGVGWDRGCGGTHMGCHLHDVRGFHAYYRCI